VSSENPHCAHCPPGLVHGLVLGMCRLVDRFLADYSAKRPEACLPIPGRMFETVPVTVTVGDWGSELDDVFQVWFDQTLILDPATPVREASATLEVIPGRHVVRLVGATVPDKIGTYELSFSANAVVVSGPPLRGAELVSGGTFTYDVLVA